MRTLTLLLALAAVSLTLPACDAFGGGDPTIGGSYSGTISETNTTLTFAVPPNTESNADATFDVGVTNNRGFSATGTGRYDFPTFSVEVDRTYTCTVADGGDSMSCLDDNPEISSRTEFRR